MKHSAFFEEARDAKKWFLMDKNYILKEAQLVLKEQLVFWTVAYAREFYQKNYNPLGIEDKTIQMIRDESFNEYHLIEPFYTKLASIYRYKHGETQLEFLFNGESHYEKYKADWIKTYKDWVDKLYQDKLVLRDILEISVFKNHGEHELELTNLRLQYNIEQYFNVRLYVYRGIVDTHEAA